MPAVIKALVWTYSLARKLNEVLCSVVILEKCEILTLRAFIHTIYQEKTIIQSH